MIAKFTAGSSRVTLRRRNWRIGFAQGGGQTQLILKSRTSPTRRDNSISKPKQALAINQEQGRERAFAEDMVRDHTAVNKQAIDLVTKLEGEAGRQRHQQGSTKAVADKRAELAKLSKVLPSTRLTLPMRSPIDRTPKWRARDAVDPVGQQCRTQEPAASRLKIFQGHQQHAEHVAVNEEALAPVDDAEMGSDCVSLLPFCTVSAHAETIKESPLTNWCSHPMK